MKRSVEHGKVPHGEVFPQLNPFLSRVFDAGIAEVVGQGKARGRSFVSPH
jgi:hypothetical protein